MPGLIADVKVCRTVAQQPFGRPPQCLRLCRAIVYRRDPHRTRRPAVRDSRGDFACPRPGWPGSEPRCQAPCLPREEASLDRSTVLCDQIDCSKVFVIITKSGIHDRSLEISLSNLGHPLQPEVVAVPILERGFELQFTVFDCGN